jgi:Rieske 2Fe-2S family protein
MKRPKDDDMSRDATESGVGETGGKLSRREFAKTSVAAGAVAVTIPGAMQASPQSTDGAPATATSMQKAGSGAVEHRDGTTIPAEYYYEMEHYLKDERYIGEHFWLLADHISRIPEPGDFFVFKFGLGDSAIVVRNESGDINAFHNVCRHRGSRLCRHDEDPRPDDDRLSVRQAGESGNAQVFRCPYLNFSRAAEPPPFEDIFGYGFERISQNFDMAALKVGTRKSYQMKANWKLGLENFMECYHCGASHDNLVATHNWDYSLSDRRRERWDQRVAEWLGPELAADQGTGSGGPYDGELNPGFLTGSVDGEPLAPLLPGDHITVARFTPRGPELTDVEIFWLVHPDAVAGVDFDPEKLRELWDITIIEDAWIVENNHVGIKSTGYRSGRYTMHETQPSYFATWYMKEIVNA